MPIIRWKVSENMKKLFISQPMRWKTEIEILRERTIAYQKVVDILGEDVEVIDTYFKNFKENPKPLHYIAKSIECLAEADIVYFAKGWENARGCKIEHLCAVEYGKLCIY